MLEQKVSKATDGKQLWFKPTDENAWLEMDFDMDDGGSRELIGKFTQAKDYGKYRVKVNLTNDHGVERVPGGESGL